MRFGTRWFRHREVTHLRVHVDLDAVVASRLSAEDAASAVDRFARTYAADPTVVVPPPFVLGVEWDT